MIDLFDKNLLVYNTGFDDELDILKVPCEKISVYGICKNARNAFARMPEEIAENISPGVSDRALRSAGVRIRFKTNSKRLGINVFFSRTVQFLSQTTLSVKGFDVYVDGKYFLSFMPASFDVDNYMQVIELGDNKQKSITIFFPYNAVIENMYLAIDKGADISKDNGYKIKKPIIFYGSSITHGFCVSRPGNVFSAIISRCLDADYINLGFSGVCHGEKEMARYISSIDKSLFVCAYDHNEQSAEELSKRHLGFYKEFRKFDSKTPILFVSSPNKFFKGELMIDRMNVVKNTYLYAKKNLDCNVYFLNGQTLYSDELRFDCSVDAIHPNDMGSYMIAKKMIQKIRKIMKE